MRPCQSAPGFTLIELLVVVSIIAVLAAMLLPALGLVRGQARISQCGSNMRQCTLAVIAYTTDNDGLLPYTESGGGGWWTNRTSPYLDDTYRNQMYAGNNPYHCPFAQVEVPNQWLYQDRFSFHVSFNRGIYASWTGTAWKDGVAPYPIGRVRSQTVALADGKIGNFGSLLYFWDFLDATGYTPWPLQGSLVVPGVPADPANPRIIRHRGTVNTSHLDGHVDRVVGVWSQLEQGKAFAR